MELKARLHLAEGHPSCPEFVCVTMLRECADVQVCVTVCVRMCMGDYDCESV